MRAEYRRRRTAGNLLVAAVAVVFGAGCDGETEDAAVETREVVGDTTIVRSAGAGPWGETELIEELRIGELEGADEFTFGRISGLAVDGDGNIYVLDMQASEVRVFAPDGSFVRRFGRQGAGPGELDRASGMAFLPDGRLVVRDQGNARMNVYSPAGESLATWSLPGGYFTSAPIFVDEEGHVYTDVVGTRAEDGTFQAALMRMDSTGAVIDTLARPFGDHEAPSLVAQNVVDGVVRGSSFRNVPFWPGPVFTLNRAGEWVAGVADSYTLTTSRADGTVLRIERTAPRVAVDPAESDNAVEQATRGMQATQPDWRWSGPRPPAEKPVFKQLRTGTDGRLWVQTSQPAVRVPPEPDAEPDAQGRPPLDTWTEPAVYDVFEADGSFLGTVRFPERFTPHVFDGDRVWGVSYDEYDVQYVTRWRVATP